MLQSLNIVKRRKYFMLLTVVSSYDQFNAPIYLLYILPGRPKDSVNQFHEERKGTLQLKSLQRQYAVENRLGQKP